MAKEWKCENPQGHPEPLLKATGLVGCCVVFNHLALSPLDSLLAPLLDSAQCPPRGLPSRDYRLVCHTYTRRLSV